MNKTNFDLFLEEQLKDPDFAARYERAGEAWDVALQLAALREQAGLSQRQLARKLKTTQQQVSRLESPAYEGHSLSMLRPLPPRFTPGCASCSNRSPALAKARSCAKQPPATKPPGAKLESPRPSCHAGVRPLISEHLKPEP